MGGGEVRLNYCPSFPGYLMGRLNRSPANGSIIMDFKASSTLKWSAMAPSIDTLNLPVPIAKATMSLDAIPTFLGRSCCAITMVTVNVEIGPAIMW
jgi:hypothetical protein